MSRPRRASRTPIPGSVDDPAAYARVAVERDIHAVLSAAAAAKRLAGPGIMLRVLLDGLTVEQAIAEYDRRTRSS